MSQLVESVQYEWDHSVHGHLTFLAGQVSLHAPSWTVLYIPFVKMTTLVTIPAILFTLIAPLTLIHFFLFPSRKDAQEITKITFLLIWLLSTLGALSLLTIVVGTHYLLPLAPPITLAGTSALTLLLSRCLGAFPRKQVVPQRYTTALYGSRSRPASFQSLIVLSFLALMLIGPHLLGLATTYAAEGYTSEFFQGEDMSVQVAYPAYREAVQWLALHTDDTHTSTRIGLVAILDTLDGKSATSSWRWYNSDLPHRFELQEINPDAPNYSPKTLSDDDYLIWPMHMIQRGFTIPSQWRSKIVHTITGGKTTYCYILARSPHLPRIHLPIPVLQNTHAQESNSLLLD